MFDVLVQVAIVVGLFCYGTATQEGGVAFFYGLFIVGGWQVLSCLVHLLAVPKSIRGGSRQVYEWALLFSLTAGWLILYFYLYIGPAMALWYFITCLVETFRYAGLPKPTYQ